MKHFALILSLLFFGLAITPCSDAHTCDEADPTEIATTHDHSDDEHDACTPFCTCQCCGISFTLMKVDKLESTMGAPIFNYSFYYAHSYTRDYLGQIWHPPTAC